MKTGHISASGFSGLYRPSTCEKRVFLLAHEKLEGEPSELDLALRELGERHEKEHLSIFPAHRNLGEGSLADRAQRTRDAVRDRAPVIYQGVLRAALPGSQDIVTGIPDFMILDGASHGVLPYRIRDCKLSQSVREGKHPEIAHQLQTYGWLFERTFGSRPVALEVYLGNRSIDTIVYAGGRSAERELGRLRNLSLLPDEPWEPVGWSKCEACPFQERCWSSAARGHDVSIVYGVDQASARALRGIGIRTYDQLLQKMDDERLAGVSRPRGIGEQRIGSAASRILSQARALATGNVVRIGALDLPAGPTVMFDLEGMPPQDEEQDMVYLWGTQVYDNGKPLGPYRGALAAFGPDGDRAGWREFLRNAADVFRRHGTPPFVHWAGYEPARVKSYIERYGDDDGIAARVLKNCFDLLKAIRDAFALPVPSYGLKAVERFCGFRRTMEDYGGDWSIGRYLTASGIADEAERSRIMAEIERYNEEDLQAMAAIFTWAKTISVDRSTRET
ncbi:MAG TPA: TM0106 family RecB-like putative nuclease [Spirochaetia bacterium]|nr:TM0106 family RecB-like putative nuclease [Spirochaetia bacterium]